MIGKIADNFAKIERQDRRVREMHLSESTWDWFLLHYPMYRGDKELWGARVVFRELKRGRVTLFSDLEGLSQGFYMGNYR